MAVSQGPQVIPDGQLLGYDGLFADAESQVGPWAGALDLLRMNFKSCLLDGLDSLFQCQVQ